MIAALLALIFATDAVYRSVVGFTPSPTSVAFIDSDTEEVTSSTTESYSYLYDYTSEPHPDYPDCDARAYFINDSFCDFSANTAECGWDGGDCCECTCEVGEYYRCGTWGYDCQDPEAQHLVEALGCTTASLTKPEVFTCPRDIQSEWVVNDTASAASLANATSCSGGNFDVKWMGHVNITKTIYVLDGASLRITGASKAVADGGGKVQVLLVSNGHLYLNNLEIVNGSSSDGGAIFVDSGSDLFVEGVSFTYNTAQNMGGAIYIESSIVTLVSTAFDGNSAVYGGAMLVLNSTVTGSGNISFKNNNATNNGGAIFIARSSYVGWNMQPEFTWIPYHSETLQYSWATYYTSTFGSIEVKWIETYNSGDNVFKNNSAGGLGGAIYVEDSEISWSGSMLLNNNRAQYGGAIYLKNDVIVEAKGSTTFYSNNALYDGGAIGAANDAGTYSGHSSLIVNGSTKFTGNTCGGNGGAIDLSDIDIEIDKNTQIIFSSNSAASSGGALYASQRTLGPTLMGVIFFNNTAEAGGAVFFSAVGTNEYSSSDDYEIYYSSAFIECRFDGNSASSTGGAIHSIAGKDYVQGTSFKNNTANFGGAMRISGTTYIFNSSFVENKSSEKGGAAISIGGVNSMEGLIFSGNGYHCSSDAFMDLDEVGFASWLWRVSLECNISVEMILACLQPPRLNGRGMHSE